MFAHLRQQKVIDLLKERNCLSVPELGSLLGASPATVRRDLGFLEEAGKIIRTHGGVLPVDRKNGEFSFNRKSRQQLAAKKAIALTATDLVKDGDTVFVDSGSTAFKVGVRLLNRVAVTLYTNSVPLLAEASSGGCKIVSIGGEVRSVSLALVGSGAAAWLARLRFDVSFVGASGIDWETGPCTTELGEAGVKAMAVRNSRKSVLLADDSKWERSAAVAYANWADLDIIVTDHAFNAAEAKTFSAHGVQILAPPK